MAPTLTNDERTELQRRATSRTSRAEDAKRAKVTLMSADGTWYSTIETASPVSLLIPPRLVAAIMSTDVSANLQRLQIEDAGPAARRLRPLSYARDAA